MAEKLEQLVKNFPTNLLLLMFLLQSICQRFACQSFNAKVFLHQTFALYSSYAVLVLSQKFRYFITQLAIATLKVFFSIIGHSPWLLLHFSINMHTCLSKEVFIILLIHIPPGACTS